MGILEFLGNSRIAKAGQNEKVARTDFKLAFKL